MPIHFMPTGDVSVGRRFNLFADEFAYAMGTEFDFAKAELLKPDTIVLNLLCVDPARGVVPNGTSHKRSAGEFWTFYNVDYAAFMSSDIGTRIAALRDGFIAAVQQVPSSRMPDRVKADLKRAAEITAIKLVSAPDRLPR
ncbi:hypothetical protein [Caulobacter sp.]|jgi:hypothetical protein|uniref:hypothetical protein n=1 Tax=Caulobacter sp. TaxID=78 RepID=UPI00161B8B4A